MAIKPRVLFWGISAGIVLLDQLTKYLVRTELRLNESVAIIPTIVHLTRVHNYGASFGMLQGAQWLFIAVGLMALVVMGYYYRTILKHVWTTFWCSLILGGALGNLIDRLWFGYVIDFLDLRIWPAFNVADSALTIGVFGLIIWSWREG